MAIKANLIIEQGADFETTINVSDDNGDPVDLTTYTGASQMRKHYTSNTSYAFTVTNTAEYGEVKLAMSANATANIVAGRYVYDCELYDSNTGKTSRLVEGIVTVTPQVTR